MLCGRLEYSSLSLVMCYRTHASVIRRWHMEANLDRYIGFLQLITNARITSLRCRFLALHPSRFPIQYLLHMITCDDSPTQPTDKESKYNRVPPISV